MKIMYISPAYKMRKSEGYVDIWSEHFQSILDGAKRGDTQVSVTDLGVNKEVNSPFFPGTLYLTDIFKTVVKAEKKGYDGVIIGCASEPGVKEAKKMVGIPVIGPVEAGISIARLLRKKWSIISPGRIDWRRLTIGYPWVEDIGISNLSIRGADVGTQNVRERVEKDPPEKIQNLVLERFRTVLKEKVPELAKSCVEEDGAEVILFGCTFWSGWEKELEAIRKKLEVLVLDPAITALKVTENIVDVCKT